MARFGLAGALGICGALLVGISLGCGTLRTPRPEAPRFSEATRPPSAEPFSNWPVPPATIEEWTTTERSQSRAFEVKMLEAKGAGAGVTGALDAKLFLVDAETDLHAKWKKSPGGLDGANNSPRRELAAYEVQKLFLDPEDYTVPTSIFRCWPLETLRPHVPDAEETLKGTHCVLGLISVWLEDVTVPEPLWDRERFLNEPGYAYYMADFNLLTYLVNHKDGRPGNFLVSMEPARRQVFAVDNGVAFDIAYFGMWFNWFVPNWNVIRVPALRKHSVDRLRALERADLDRLGVLVQLEQDESGLLQPAEREQNLDPAKGARVHGPEVQLGLKRSEIDDVWERIQTVLRRIDSGELPVF